MKQLENQVWRAIKDQIPRQLSVVELTKDFDRAAQEANRQAIEELKTELKQPKLTPVHKQRLTKDLIIRKVALKQQNRLFTQAQLQHQLTQWHGINHESLSVGDRFFLTQHEVQVAREIDRLSSGQELSMAQTDVVNVPVYKVSDARETAIVNRLTQELRWLKQADTAEIIQAVYPGITNHRQARRLIAARIRLIKLKAQIRRNQDTIKTQPNAKKVAKLKAANGQHYAEVKQLSHDLKQAETGESPKNFGVIPRQSKRFLSVNQRLAVHHNMLQAGRRIIQLNQQNQTEDRRAQRAHEQLVYEMEQEEQEQRYDR